MSLDMHKNVHLSYLEVVYILDHEVVPRPCKFVIGCWTCPGTTSVYTKGKKCQSDYDVRGPQKTCLKAYIIHWHGLMGFAVGEAKEVL